MKIDDVRELQRAVARTQVGNEARVGVLRDGETITLRVVVAERPDEASLSDNGDGDEQRNPFDDYLTLEGLELLPLNDDLRRRFRLNEAVEGVLIAQVRRSSKAYRAGFRAGMVIRQANGADVRMPNDVQAVIDAAREAGRPSVLLYVAWRGNSVFLPLELSPLDDD